MPNLMPVGLLMPNDAEPKTKTVRLPTPEANMLQTISSLKEEMGEKFKPVEYLSGLVSKPIRQLHAETLEAYNRWKAGRDRKTK